MRGNPTRVWAGVLCVGATFILAAALAAAPSNQDWPQFRGIHRDGNSPQTGLIDSWPEDGPREVWRQPIGEGYSGIVVVGDRLYTMYAGEHDGTPMDVAAAFDAGTGKELWSSPVGAMHTSGFGKGPNATPAVDGDTIYVLGASGDLAALATKNGEERWRINLKDAFGSKQPGFGFSASALVDGKLVILEGGGPEGKSYVALDKKTGEMLWSHGDTADEPGYNSAIAIDVGDKRRYVYIADTRIVSLDETGNEIWSHPWPEGETHASPLFVPPDRIFASGVEGVGAALFRVKEQGGAATVEELWKSRFMRNHFSSSVLHGEHIYGFDNANLRCISVEDAKSQWVKRGLGKGSLIYADGHLIVLSDTGKLVLAEATPEDYKERGSVQALEGRSWTAPTLAGGTLYLRNGAEIVAYDLDG